MTDNSLFRENQKSIETVILIGNGVFKNGWDPIDNILSNKNIGPFQEFSKQHWLNHENKELFISYFGEQARQNREHLWLYYAHEVCKFLHPDLAEQLAEEMDKHFKLFELNNNFRKTLAQEYLSFSEKAQVIEFPNIILQEIKKETTAIITINWDMFFWNWNNKSLSNICQLHGRCDFADTLILPTEVFIEDIKWKIFYPKNMENETLNENLRNKIDTYSYKMNRFNLIYKAHHKATDWLESAKKIIVWGVAFNTYDSELNIACSCRIKNKDPLIIVINPNPQHRDRALALFLGHLY